MLRHAIPALLLVAACSGSLYPRFETVARDPAAFDLLFSSTAGPHSESWYFSDTVNVSSFIIPTQVDWSSGPEVNGTYMEDVELLIYEVDDSSEGVLVGNGSFSGKLSMGQTLHIPVANASTGGELSVQHYSAGRTVRYRLSFQFKTTGLYPWFLSRSFSSFSAVDSHTDEEGLALGLTFSYA